MTSGRYLVQGGDEWGLRLPYPDVVVTTYEGQRATVAPANSSVTYGVSVTGDRVVVDGLELEGFVRASVYVGRTSTTQIGVILAHMKVTGGVDGIRSIVSNGVLAPIKGLLVYDVLIDGAQIGFNCGEGPCNDVRLDHLRVRGRGLGTSSGDDAIAFERGDNIAVVDCEVSGASADGIDTKATRVAVVRTKVGPVGRNGIKLWRGGDIVDSAITGTGADGAVVLAHGAAYRIVRTSVTDHALDHSSYTMTAAYDYPTEVGSLLIDGSTFTNDSGPVWVSGAFALAVTNSTFSPPRNGGPAIVWKGTAWTPPPSPPSLPKCVPCQL